MDERQKLDMMKASYEKNSQNINPILKEAIEKEIKVREYVVDPVEYEKNIRFEAERQARIKERKKSNQRLKIFKTRVALTAAAGFILMAPIIVEGTKVVINKIIEIDNENFEKDLEQQRQQVEELTGHTMQEIMEKGNSR